MTSGRHRPCFLTVLSALEADPAVPYLKYDAYCIGKGCGFGGNRG